jgi:hypothetical protein
LAYNLKYKLGLHCCLLLDEKHMMIALASNAGNRVLQRSELVSPNQFSEQVEAICYNGKK